MNKLLLFCLPFILFNISCSDSPEEVSITTVIKSSTVEEGCPEKPGEINSQEVKQLKLDSNKVSETNQIKAGDYKGYSFKGEAGQQLSYSTEDDICLWVYAPNNQLVDGTELPETGNYLVQVTAPKGIKTFNLSMSLTTPALDNTSSNTSLVQNVNRKTNSNFTNSEEELTKEKAIEIVEGWYKAKPRIFGYSFDESLVNKYATGQLYYETLEKDGGGSMGWLKRNNCYYDYAFSNIDNVWLFSTSGTRPLLKIQVSEKLQLNGPSNAGCNRPSNSYQKNASYWFEKDNGTWKISYYDVE